MSKQKLSKTDLGERAHAHDMRTIKKLAEKSLKYKWIENQFKNSNLIISPCSFCNAIKINGVDCSKCKIPKIICDDDGYKGLIGFIFLKHGNIKLKDINSEVYKLIRESLIEVSIYGYITPKKEKIIKNFYLKYNKNSL